MMGLAGRDPIDVVQAMLERTTDNMDGLSFAAMRSVLGVTQADLARRLDVSRGMVARWENGSLRISKRTAMALQWLVYSHFARGSMPCHRCYGDGCDSCRGGSCMAGQE